MPRLSQITPSLGTMQLSDFLVGITAGPNDLRFNPAQVFEVMQSLPYQTLDGGSEFILEVGGVEHLRVANSGFVVLSNAGGSSNFNSGKLQIVGTNFNDASVRMSGFNSATGAWFIRSDASLGGQGIVANGEPLGQLFFLGSDGVATQEAARIEILVDGVPGLNDMPGRLSFMTTPDGTLGVVERLRIDNGGHVVIGGAAAQSEFVTKTSALQVLGTTIDQTSITACRYQASPNTPARLDLGHSRGTTIGSYTVVADGDTLGEFNFLGSDGSTMHAAAVIRAFVEGTPGLGDMPGRLVFFTTPDGTTTPVERIRISQDGFVVLTNGGGASNFNSGKFQVVGTNFNDASMRISGFNTQPNMWFLRSDASLGGMGLVANGEALCQLFFQGSDGVASQEAARIEVLVDGVAAVGDMPGRFSFQTTLDGTVGATERLRIDNAGHLVTGNHSALSTFIDSTLTPYLQLLGTGADTSALAITVFSTNVNARATINLAHSKNASIGSYTLASLNDVIGDLSFQASTGTQFEEAARIRGDVDGAGTPSATSMPGRLRFYTAPDGTISGVERLRIDSTGQTILQPGTATPAGGSTAVRLVFGSTAGFGIYIGSGVPSVSAAQGSVYLRSDGSSTSTRLYVNTNGTTGWTNVVTAT